MDNQPEIIDANLEYQDTTELIPRKRPPVLLLVAGGLLVVAILAGAAFIAGRYLNNQPLAGSLDDVAMAVPAGGEGGQSMVQSRTEVQFEPAPELPQTEPGAAGLFVRREDNSLFVGTGNLTVSAFSGPEGGALEFDAKYDGPVVEVVVTGDTQVYQDVTMRAMGEPTQARVVVQQTVEPGDLEDLSDSSTITAWGKKVGDRLVADVLVYSVPAMFNGKP